MNTERIQQGRLLVTADTSKLTYDQRDKCNRQEQSMMFMRFTESDLGRSREYLATFESPEKCKAFVDNYNSLIDSIHMLNWQLKVAIDEIGNHCEATSPSIFATEA